MSNSAVPPHPLLPLSADEISAARDVILRSHGVSTVLSFRAIQLQEPKKVELTPFLIAEHAGQVTSSTPRPPRLAKLQYHVKHGKGSQYCESVVNINSGEEVAVKKFDPDFPASLSVPDILGLIEVSKSSKLLKEALEEFAIPDNYTLSIDPWPYGGPDLDSDNTRYIQALIYARDTSSKNPDSNHYAFPIPLIPVFDVTNQKIVRVDRCATGGIGDPLHPPPRSSKPKELFKKHSPAEYVPELLDTPMRKDLKPLNITQPEGPSFTVTDGNLVTWQKWRFRLGFTLREGAVLHDLTYDHRPILYRMSLSEMTVPYADPRPPFHHKQAFDFGDGGVGMAANDLQIGCDCLGRIHYFGAVWVTPDGQPAEATNRVCMHEQDGGILWKHTNYVTGRGVVTRMRELVLQFVVTLGNYEYVFAYRLDQAGGIALETRATGIVSVVAIDYGKKSEYGTVVQDGVLAQNHQHLIAVRIDPAIDSYADGETGVIVEESRAVPMNEDTNPFGNGYQVVRSPVEKAGWYDAQPTLNRKITMINWNKTNPKSGRNVGYKFMPEATQLLLADPKSRVAKRALFAQHHVWVTGYRDDELWAAGEFTNLSKEEIGGVADMVRRGDWFLDSADGKDVDEHGGSNGKKSHPVVWSILGLTHNPRVEDWPVMPAEIHTLHIKPAYFFDKNPALDVPSTQNPTSVRSSSNCCASCQSRVQRWPQYAAPHWQGERDLDFKSIGEIVEAPSIITDPSESESTGSQHGEAPASDSFVARFTKMWTEQ